VGKGEQGLPAVTGGSSGSVRTGGSARSQGAVGGIGRWPCKVSQNRLEPSWNPPHQGKEQGAVDEEEHVGLAGALAARREGTEGPGGTEMRRSGGALDARGATRHSGAGQGRGRAPLAQKPPLEAQQRRSAGSDPQVRQQPGGPHRSRKLGRAARVCS
jgi:hypothetical protein